MTTCSIKEILMKIFLPCSGRSLKGVLIRKGAGVAEEEALEEEVVVDGKDELWAVI